LVFGRKLSSQTAVHILGALAVVAFAGICRLGVLDNGLHRPGIRVCLLLGGMLVTLGMLMFQARDRTILAYGAGFFAAFAIFCAIGS